VAQQAFLATVQGVIEIQAEDMAEALALLKARYPDLRVSRLEEA